MMHHLRLVVGTVAALVFFGPVSVTLGDETGLSPGTGREWRRVAFLPPPNPTQDVYRYTVNLGRVDWWSIMPLKLTVEGASNGVFSVKMNGKPVGEMRSAPYEIAVGREAFRGETGNELEIEMPVRPSSEPLRITLCGNYSSSTGPLVTEREFFTACLDTSLPELSGIPARVASGDMAGARRIFAEHVRRSMRPETSIGDWRNAPTPDMRRNLENRAADIMCYRLETLNTAWHFADHKVEWEFNPTHNGYREWNYHISYFDCGDPLARLYLITHDERFAQTWKDLLSSFISYNPVPLSARSNETKCWRSLDSSGRASTLARQFAVFYGSPVCDNAFTVLFFRSVWEHLKRLRTGHARGGNWLTNEMSTLARLSMLYPFFTEAKAWRDYAVKRLEGELERQIYKDGFQCELTPLYHTLVMRHYLNVVETAQAYEVSLPPSFVGYVKHMFEMFTHLARPDLRAPGMNDSGDIDGTVLMTRAVRLFPDRPDLRWFATRRREGRPPEALSCSMPYSGFAVMRNSWNPDGVWGLMDCGPLGMAHVHEDKLNVLLSAYGRNMVVEGGTYEYDTSDMRRYVLSTRAHNTVRIDGKDQNRKAVYRFTPEEINKKADFRFEIGPSSDWAEAAYTEGYGHDRIDVRHARKLIFHKAEGDIPPFFAVIDRLSAADGMRHSFEQIWHLEDCRFALRPEGFMADFGGDVRLCGEFSLAGLVDMIGRKEPELQGWIPIFKDGPHEHRPVHTPTLTGTFDKPLRIVAVFVPFRGDVAPAIGVKASSDPAAQDYSLVMPDGSLRVFREP